MQVYNFRHLEMMLVIINIKCCFYCSKKHTKPEWPFSRTL